MTDAMIEARRTLSALSNWRDYIIYIGFVVIFVIFAATLGERGFLDPNNLLNIIRQTAIIAVVSVAMTFVLGYRRDRPVGRRGGRNRLGRDRNGDRSVSASSAVLVCGLGTGAIVGAVNGWLTTGIGIPSFLTTLAMMGIARGFAMWISATAGDPDPRQALSCHLRRG